MNLCKSTRMHSLSCPTWAKIFNSVLYVLLDLSVICLLFYCKLLGNRDFAMFPSRSSALKSVPSDKHLLKTLPVMCGWGDYHHAWFLSLQTVVFSFTPGLLLTLAPWGLHTLLTFSTISLPQADFASSFRKLKQTANGPLSSPSFPDPNIYGLKPLLPLLPCNRGRKTLHLPRSNLGLSSLATDKIHQFSIFHLNLQSLPLCFQYLPY